MRLILPLLGTALLFTSGAVQARPKPDREAELASTIAGRIAGKPVDCLFLRDIRSSRIIDGTAIVYETSGRTLYVNRPRSNASSLRRDNVLVTDTHSAQLCSIDIVRLFDSASRTPAGFVGLGEFVPYTKPKASPAN